MRVPPETTTRPLLIITTTVPHDSLPEGWAKPTPDESGRERNQFRLNAEDGATFLVWVIERGEDEPFQIRLTTISDDGDRVRHDYPIDVYDSREAAIAGAESFVARLDWQRREGRLSDDDPTVEDVQRFIVEFVGLSIGVRLRRFLGGIGQ